MNAFPSFPAFFTALWDSPPFPWQTRLAKQVENGSWPGWITLPTGSGKTAALDIAVYELARQAATPGRTRTAPVRTVFAVNRRIVVDEAYERAKAIADKLRDALSDRDCILHPVARSLKLLSGLEDGKPLETYPLRGATFTDHSWARTPAQPLVMTTTLDQLGSRLLFRGYGVSEFARPIHAGLLANDALLLLDEAHTARAFSQTLEAINHLRNRAAEPLGLPFAAVQLTATPPARVSEPFSIADEDRRNAVIAARLGAPKPAELIRMETATGAQRHARLAAAMSKKALDLLKDGARRILLVVNRVATAEALLAKLQPARANATHDAVVHLLTGRLRPLDRDRLIEEINQTHQLKSSRPSPGVPKLILIATQTVEVGADYDFDALLTELAPLDSLRQRFGRLNRTGRAISAPAAIFAPEEAIDPRRQPDPIYGECLPQVWAWLQQNAAGEPPHVDFGLAAMDRILPRGDALTPLLAPAPDAPILLPPHLDLLCQTSPEPHVSPDPALYIHGPGRDFAEVSVVLRADLETCRDPLALLDAVPPLGTEAATVPLPFARRWLINPEEAVKDDVSGDAPDDGRVTASEGEIRAIQAYRFRHGETSRLDRAADLAPGDLLVLPAQTPRDLLKTLLPLLPRPDGEPENPWSLDQYEQARLLSRDRLRIRFHPAMRDSLAARLPEEGRARFHELTGPLFAGHDEESRWVFEPNAWRNAFPETARLLAEQLPPDDPLAGVWQHAAFLGKVRGRPRNLDDWHIGPIGGEGNIGVLLTNRSRVGSTPWPFDPDDLGRQGNESEAPQLLGEHTGAVTRRAERNAFLIDGLLREGVTIAARWHDAGKLDPRFQALLHGCALWAVAAKKVCLAKSGRRSGPLERRYFQSSGLPEGFRHELLSALAAAGVPELAAHPERDLILHLIASHHGRCRAMAPVVPDPDPEPFEFPAGDRWLTFPGQDAPLAHIASGVTDRFWKLTRRFGWWGLPYLETLLRLADQSESAAKSSP